VASDINRMVSDQVLALPMVLQLDHAVVVVDSAAAAEEVGMVVAVNLMRTDVVRVAAIASPLDSEVGIATVTEKVSTTTAEETVETVEVGDEMAEGETTTVSVPTRVTGTTIQGASEGIDRSKAPLDLAFAVFTFLVLSGVCRYHLLAFHFPSPSTSNICHLYGEVCSAT